MCKEELKKYRKFNNPKEVYEWVNKNYTKEQLDAFDMNVDIDCPVSFIKGDSWKINKVIRVAGLKRAEEYFKDFHLLELQRQLLECLIPEDIVVSRYISLKEWLNLLKWTSRGKNYLKPDFFSTTLLKDDYSMEDIKKRRLCVDIYVPKGTKGTFLPEVNPQSPEFEILMPCNRIIKRLGFFKFLVEVD